MSDAEAVAERVLDIVARVTQRAPETLRLDMRLFGEDLDLDSLTAVRIVATLEKELGVVLDEDDLNLAALESIGSLARFAARQRGGGP